MCLRKNNLSFSPSAAFFVAAAWRAGRVHPKLFLREKKGRREKNGAEGNFGLLELLYHGRREGGTRSFGPALLPPPSTAQSLFLLVRARMGPSRVVARSNMPPIKRRKGAGSLCLVSKFGRTLGTEAGRGAAALICLMQAGPRGQDSERALRTYNPSREKGPFGVCTAKAKQGPPGPRK